MKNNCMFFLPSELRGIEQCGLFKGAVCVYSLRGKNCVGYTPHTKESKEALKKVIKAKLKSLKEKGKNE